MNHKLFCWIVGMTPDKTSRFTCPVVSRSDQGTFFPGLQDPVVPTFQQDTNESFSVAESKNSFVGLLE
jgi:hypothetical protein